MLIPLVSWLILGISSLAAVRSILDMMSKSEESLRAHAEDLAGTKLAHTRRSTRKEKIEIFSALIGMLVAVFGLSIAATNLVWPPEPYDPAPQELLYIAPLAWLLGGIIIAAFCSSYFSRIPKPLP